MAGIWVLGEVAGDGSLTKLSDRGRDAGPRARRGRAGGADVTGVVDRRGPGGRGRGARRASCRRVLAVTEPATADHAGRHDRRPAAGGARRGARPGRRPGRRRTRGPRPRGRAVGADRSGRAGQRHRAARLARRPGRDAQRVRRQAHHRERASPAARASSPSGPNSVTAEPAATAGHASRPATADRRAAASRRSRRRSASRPRARPRSIDDARIIVAGGRGVGGPDGFGLIEDLADGARRRGRGDPRGGRLGLDPVQPADRPDRQDRQAAALPRAGHQRRDPAQGRDADRRRRSSPSTATPTPRSPTSPTWSSSATCSRSATPSSPQLRARSG